MSLSDENLAHLFSQARNQKPVATLSETKKAFITATVVAAGGVLATKGLLQLLTAKKWIIMLSTVSIITAGTLIVSLSSDPAKSEENALTNEVQSSIITVNEPKEIAHSNLDASPYLETEIPTELAAVDPTNFFELIDDEPEFLEVNDFIVAEDSNGIEFKTINPTNKEPRIAESKGEIKPYARRFEITENTTKKDFEKMKRDAENDGIDFFYRAKYKEDKLSKLRLELKIESEEEGQTQYVMTSLTIQGEFSYTLAWDKSNEGQATHITCGHTEEFEEENEDDVQGAIEESVRELENLIAELELNGVFVSLDSFADHISKTTEFHWAEMEDKMDILEVELEETMKELEQEDLQAMMKMLTESSVELVKTLQEELEKIEIKLEKEQEMEKEQKEIENELEEMEKEQKKMKKEQKDEEEKDKKRNK